MPAVASEAQGFVNVGALAVVGLVGRPCCISEVAGLEGEPASF